MESSFVMYDLTSVYFMLGTICGSAHRTTQSVDPYFAQEFMVRAEICGSSGAIHEFCM